MPDYTSAKPGRFRPLAPDISGRGALDLADRRKLMRACQSLARNNSAVRAYIGRLQDLIVGDGFLCKPGTPDAAFNRAARERWERYWEEEADAAGILPGYQIARALIRAGLTDGDCALVRDQDGHVQIVEAERIVHSTNLDTVVDPKSKNTVVQGIELDARGRALRIWIAPWGPRQTADAGKATPVSASDVRMMRWPQTTQPNMVRGEPGLQAVVEQMNMLARFMRDTAAVQQLLTAFGIVVESPNPQNTAAVMRDALTGPSDSKAGPASNLDELKFDGPTVIHAETGTVLKAVQPTLDAVNVREFTNQVLAMAGADIGLPIPLSQLDMTGLTASNAKMLLQIAWRNFAAVQRWIAQAMAWVYRWKIQQWIAAGELPGTGAPDPTAVEFVAPQPPMIDFEKEVSARVLAISQRLQSNTAAMEELGLGEFEEVQRTLARELEIQRQLGTEPQPRPGQTPTQSQDAPAQGNGAADQASPDQASPDPASTDQNAS